MNKKTLRVLEYHKIKEMLINEAKSEMTKNNILEMMPELEKNQVQQLLLETSEAASIIIQRGSIPLSQMHDISEHILRTQKGGALLPKHLLQILTNLRVVKNIKNFFRDDTVQQEGIIISLVQMLVTHRNLEDDIDRCIISEDEISDHASTELRNIRRNIGKLNDGIKTKLNSITSSSTNRVMLQDAIVTVRQGRYVIPVKQEYRGKFPGIVHDQSSTGATLFIEPMSIVNMNNELKELHLKEEAEIERILAELSAHVAENAEEILSNQEVLIRLDYIFAKGKLSVRMNGIEPKINDKGFIRIKKGRHPLLDSKSVVPIDIHMGDDFDTLMITGPNTGGKTVTLKTVGLFILMTQSGLHIPAEYGTEMCIFEKVFADIGDEQSIEQSLSTFSSHMTNIVEIIENVNHKSAVFLDELGAGTDPTEGAALAIAILDYLYNKGAKTIATTHYTELKKYAVVNDGVENASVEFDVETLSPTYKLSIGTPGKSNAFEISQKLGLNDFIIQDARKLLGNEDIAFEDIISTIEKDKKEAEEERDEAIRLKIEIKHLKNELEEKKLKLSEQKERIIKEAKEEARKILKETKAYADEAHKKLTQLEKVKDKNVINKDYENLRKDVRGRLSDVSEKIKDVPIDSSKVPKNLKIGDSVKILTLDQEGAVATVPDKKGDLMVQVGVMKINVNIKQLRKIKESIKENMDKTSVGNLYRSKSASVAPQVDVRGQLLEEAIMNVDKYLDDAYIAGLTQVTVVHGKGEGILRDGIQKILKTHKHVESYRRGGYNEGGDGATIVLLK